MLPLQLHIANFASFREPATIDFADVDYFALVGPTGAGKTTVIDAICFALYGTVPRWGKENVVSLALAPSATSGKVALVFEVGGRRYGVVRALVRNAKGVVGTKEARLEELDSTVPSDADLVELLEAVVRPLAEGGAVTDAVQRLTGLEYRYFTQCVMLPQGQFAEFLHAEPRKRQDLLVQLLGAEVFERIRRRAVEEQEAARRAAAFARDQLAKLADADEAAEQTATERLATLQTLAAEVRSAVGTLREHDEAVRQARNDREIAQQQLTTVTSLAMPKDVPKLAGDLRAADEEIARLADEIAQREDEEQAAEEQRVRLGDKTVLTQALEAHEARERHTAKLGEVEADAQAAVMQAEGLLAEVGRVEQELREAKARRDQIRDTRVALDLAHRLAVGKPCPVCLRPVAELPHHPEPADLVDAEREIGAREANVGQLRDAHRKAEVAAGKLQQKREELHGRLAELTPRLETHPDRSKLEQQLAAIKSADGQVTKATAAVRTARKQHQAAADRAAALRRKTEQGWRDLDQARDTVIALGAPPLTRDDLHHAWTTLLAWRDQAADRQRQTLATLTERLADAERVRGEQRASLVARLERDGVAVPPEASPEQISEAATTATTRAEAHLEQVRANRERARTLDEQARSSEQQAHIAHELTLVLRANNFEKWLCAEALDLLVTAASETLRDLSGGQYELVLGAKGDIEVVDYAEAGMRRNVRTLSGGETFQAALALALALSSQVAGLAATAARSLDSIFLDEGFGTLDPATLDTVATTLERLAAGGDRMVGIVTHIPALADRVPVRFEVTRDSAGSHLTKAVT